MSATVLAKHEPYWATGHLGNVAASMEIMGEPTIRVMATGAGYAALEGSHRLAAAYHLGIEPKLVVEIPDELSLDASHWIQVTASLPSYEFRHVLVLDLRAFGTKNDQA